MGRPPEKTEIDAAREPIVLPKGGDDFATSRDVAAFFGKEYRHVLDSIDNIMRQEPEGGMASFGQTPYLEPSNGQTYRMYEMDRDGFTLLAMSFNGFKLLR